MGDARQQDIAAVDVIDLELIRRFMVVTEKVDIGCAVARVK